MTPLRGPLRAPTFIGPPEPRLDRRSRERLGSVHPDLQSVVDRASELSRDSFRVGEGRRTLSRQSFYFFSGKSKTIEQGSHLAGYAVDLYSRTGDPNSTASYSELARAMSQASEELGIPIVWGGNWGWDYPHFELSRQDYPRPPVPLDLSDEGQMNIASVAVGRMMAQFSQPRLGTTYLHRQDEMPSVKYSLIDQGRRNKYGFLREGTQRKMLTNPIPRNSANPRAKRQNGAEYGHNRRGDTYTTTVTLDGTTHEVEARELPAREVTDTTVVA